MMPLTNLQLIEQCDSFPDATTQPALFKETTAKYARFMHVSHTLSFVIPIVLEALKDSALSGDWWDITPNGLVLLKGGTYEERTKNIQATAVKWREAKKFTILEGWRDEMYTVYAPTSTPIFEVERTASALFGFVTYGAHMMAYVSPTADKPLRLWVPTRASGKSTYAGMLDNTVAGGIGNGITPFECIVKEAGEEASLESEFVRSKIRSIGCISYFYLRSKDAGGEIGLLQPEVQYCFEIELPEDVIPKPCDDEVACHNLMTVEECQTEMAKGRFKPNTALVLLDFFIRHGIITAVNEPDYIEILGRLHRRFEFPTA